MARLLASAEDARRLAGARAAVVLVGGYDGSGNYGDVLQVATAIETVARLPGSPLPVAIVEAETLGHHRALLARFPERLGGTVYLHYDETAEPAPDGLTELADGALPRRAALYVYGGGFLNQRWGGRKIAHVEAAEALHGGRSLPVVASGLQADEPAVAPGGVAHDLLARAAAIGVRDAPSLDFMRAHLPSAAAERIELAGDDATPFLRSPAREAEPVVNLHLNDGVWVSDDTDALAARIVALLRALGEASPAPLRLQPTIAYEDFRVSERAAIASLLDRYGAELEGAGVVPAEPIDLLDDAIDNGLGQFRRARLTVACSYHVTLSSLLAGIPTVLLADNEYYEQKAAGLRDLFGLGPGLVGARGTDADAVAAASAMGDGADREALVGQLRGGAARVLGRYDRGRETTAAALAEALRPARRPPRDVARAAVQRGARVARRRARILLDRARAAEPPARPDPAADEERARLAERVALAGAQAEEALEQGKYAIELARDVSLPARMLALMSWLELHAPPAGPPISVVLATRDRPALLGRAIDSVLAQRFERWQLVVVDDGDTDAAPTTLAAYDDERIVVAEGPRRGLGAARNAGLARAAGEIVAYLDDDNVMHPGWLQAVAHVFSQRDDVDLVYGVALAEHRVPGDLGEHGWWPSFWQLPWSREKLERENVTDAGSLAHRRELDGARFDEDLPTGEDWDLLLRLTADREALAVPAISHAYAMAGEDRMSVDAGHRAGLEEIRRRHAEA